MSARDDYPAVTILADAAEGREKLPEAVRMLHEIERLRAQESLRRAIEEMRSERAAARHRPGSAYDERQRGELNAFDIVLRLLDAASAPDEVSEADT